MFAPGGVLEVKQTLADVAGRRPVVRVRVRFIIGRTVHTDSGATYHYSQLQVPAKSPPYTFDAAPLGMAKK